jgi:hypothetical protein
MVGLRLFLNPNPGGTASRWQNHHFSHGSSFAVELPAGPMTAAAVARHVNAILTLVR